MKTTSDTVRIEAKREEVAQRWAAEMSRLGCTDDERVTQLRVVGRMTEAELDAAIRYGC